ncbi:hypothetical protein RSOLAG1IB_08066 [Rhizoctonia solani AG-1 IB]|uniref:C2H2-type domain-containing protein n=1 Tax=Thanatephorus cucumeris (strain AG1-IB / isolate 7/3/14) TaxID=1108050 RepID=A0A0B7FIK9_THACB|nr:hypothetical protein RSOLAG1IB_08066 [Rhizoctonia solani AG-1 IB]
MDASNNNEERQEFPLSPLLSALLLQLGPTPSDWAGLSSSEYNQPQLDPAYYDTQPSYSLHDNQPIQPFRRYNYLDANGEDLGSRQYTLGPDNFLELQLTDTCAPSDLNNLLPVATSIFTSYPTITPLTIDEQELSTSQAPDPYSPLSHGSSVTSEFLPPSSSEDPFLSFETPVTPESEPGPSRRGRRSSASRNSWSCVPCNKTFYRKAELDRHLTTSSTHQRERRFRCRHCGDMFTRADARGRHERMCPSNPDSSGSPKGKGKGKGKWKGKERERGSSSD